MSAVNPNVGVNVVNSSDYSKCCPRRCSVKSSCCGAGRGEPKEKVCKEPSKEVIQEVVKEVLSEYAAYSQQHSPRKSSISL